MVGIGGSVESGLHCRRENREREINKGLGIWGNNLPAKIRCFSSNDQGLRFKRLSYRVFMGYP